MNSHFLSPKPSPQNRIEDIITNFAYFFKTASSSLRRAFSRNASSLSPPRSRSLMESVLSRALAPRMTATFD